MHRVYLVPGFFGFAHLGDLRYFGHVHRFLEDAFAHAGIEAGVHEVASLPTASLKRRAIRLFESMGSTAGPDDILHVVGHSSGGLDARLLVSPGVELEYRTIEPIAARISSVVSVATPHRGTPAAAAFSSLAGKRLLQLLSAMTIVVLRRGHLPVQATLRVGQLLKQFDMSGVEPGIEDELISGLLGDLTEERRTQIQSFFADVGDDQALLSQITPDALDVFNSAISSRPTTRYGSVVTRARRPSLAGMAEMGLSASAQASLAVFAACHMLAGRGPHPNGLSADHLAALGAKWPELSLDDNDGMVPTMSQTWGDVIATVDADHLDVIGHFGEEGSDPPHYDWIRTGTGFNKAKFVNLWGDVFRFLTAEPR